MTHLDTTTLRLPMPSRSEDLLRYAAACGDFHALHYDPTSPEAQQAGGCVLPGRYQHGLIARLLRECFPGELEQLECSYLAPAYVGQEIWLEARLRPDPRGASQIRVKLVDAEGRLLLAGHARMRRPESTL